ncbi:MAG: sigma-70 family RNA polymerase sigma factor [Candidatus Eremiobacteraeota bacterium]|nr:sigma-70 family RNA polymerase sigma factor [Candidatus Eremiobacteraeota bacterium]
MAADFVARRHDALDRAYRAYGRQLYSVARHVLGSDADAQDCVHDALLRIWQRPETFRPERGSLRAYLSVCVRNEAIGRKRSAARHFTIEQRLGESEDVRYELEIEDHAERARLREALGTLPVEQRQALECAYWRHLSHGQIAETLDVPLGTIKSRLAMGLRKLQRALGAYEHRAG